MLTCGNPRRRALAAAGHAVITVDSDDVREVCGQLPGEHAFLAADVYRSVTAGGQVAQDPVVEVLVVAPGVTCIDLGQRLMQRPWQVPDIHAKQLDMVAG